MRIIHLWTILLTTSFGSCVTQKKCLEKFPPTVEYIDTVVYVNVPVVIPADTMRLVDTVPCDNFDIGNDSIRVVVKDRIIKIESIRKADTIIVDSVRVEVVTEMITRDVKVIRWDLILGALIVGMLAMVFLIRKIK